MKKDQISPFHMEDKIDVIKEYEKRIDKFGMTVDTLKSGGQSKQNIRHLVHSQIDNLNNKVILDVGCGIAQFYEYLISREITVKKYIGLDIVEKFVKANKKSFPNCEFYVLDIFKDEIPLNFDYAIVSQVFNNKYRKSNNLEVLKAAIKNLYKSANKGVSIDMMSTYVDYQNAELDYFNPSELFNFAKSLTKYVNLRHDYLRFEFCLYLYKQNRFN